MGSKGADKSGHKSLHDLKEEWNDAKFAPPFKRRRRKVQEEGVKKDKQGAETASAEKGAGKSRFLLSGRTWQSFTLTFGLLMTFLMTQFTYNFFASVFEGDYHLKRRQDTEWELEKKRTKRPVKEGIFRVPEEMA